MTLSINFVIIPNRIKGKVLHFLKEVGLSEPCRKPRQAFALALNKEFPDLIPIFSDIRWESVSQGISCTYVSVKNTSYRGFVDFVVRDRSDVVIQWVSHKGLLSQDGIYANIQSSWRDVDALYERMHRTAPEILVTASV